MEVIQVPDRPAPPRFYAVAGRLLFVESPDLRLGNLIERLCAGWQLTPVVFPERPPDIHIYFLSGAAAPQIPRKLNHFRIAEDGVCYRDAANIYLALGRSLLHLQHDDPVTVRIWLESDPGEAMLARITSFAICAALRRYGMLEIHSAGMIHPESERCVLIIGSSGTGKSTLALALARAGWPYLSDDQLLLSLVGNEVEARGFRSYFALRNENGTLKTCFEPDSVFPTQRRQRAVPGVLLFIRLDGERETRLDKLEQLPTMMRLIRACPWATYDTSVAEANMAVLGALARQTIAFDLYAGRDLLEPGRASELLSQHIGQN